jgi:ABC-2 type transport system ATP-binding protein
VRALLHDPAILFLDEPTSALDPQSAKHVRDTIHNLRSEGRTIILCTHNLSEAEQLADRIAIIARGKIRAIGTGESLMRDHMGPPVMELRTAEPLNGALNAIRSLVTVTESGKDWLRFAAPDNPDVHRRLLRAMDEHGHSVLSLAEVSRSLESLYLKIVEEVE